MAKRPSPEEYYDWGFYNSNYGGSGWYPKYAYQRTYASGVTPGYPEVVQYNSYLMETFIQHLDPNFWWSKQVMEPVYQNTWYTGPSDGSSRGVQWEWRRIFDDGYTPKNRCRTKIAEAVKRDKVNLGEFLGELPQTYGMFRTALNVVTTGYRAAKRGDVEGFIKALSLHRSHANHLIKRGSENLARTAASAFLQAKYGWLPLLRNVYDGVSTMHSRVQGGVVMKVKKSSVETKTRQDTLLPSFVPVAASAWQKQRSKARIELLYLVSDSSTANLNDWGITNPLEVAWELTTMSHVVDWFIPIGRYISTFDAYLGVTFHSGYETIFLECTSGATYKPLPATYPDVWNASGSDSFQHIYHKRDVLASFPRAGIPRFRNPVSGTHVQELIAMAVQVFGGKSR